MRILLFVLLLVNSVCIAQVAPKKTNEIRVKPVSFRQAANGLLDAGFTFQVIDSNYNTITTVPKEYARKVVQLNVRVKDGTAIITGYCGNSISDFSSNPGRRIMDGKSEIENRGMKGSLLKESFEAMDNFARSLGGQISYAHKE